MARRPPRDEEAFALDVLQEPWEPDPLQVVRAFLEAHEPSDDELAMEEEIKLQLVEIAGEWLTGELGATFITELYQATHDKLKEASGHIIQGKADVFNEEHGQFMQAVDAVLLKEMAKAAISVTQGTARDITNASRRSLRRKPQKKRGALSTFFAEHGL